MIYRRKKFFILIPIAILLVLPFVIMILWNNIVVAVFGIKAITYLQAIGLFILSRILFGNFGYGKGSRPPFSKQLIKDKMINLSDDEKCKMKEEWEKRKQ